MKRFTFMLLAAFIAVVAFAQKPRLMPTAHVFEQTTLRMAPVKKTVKTASHVNRTAKVLGVDEVWTLPEGATSETYYTTGGIFYVSTSSGFTDATSRMSSVQVAVVGSDIYVQGLAYWFKDGWIKGTIDGTTATFPNGQLIGVDEYGAEYIVGSDDGETVCDIVFSYDAEEGVLTAVTPYVVESGAADAVSSYCYWFQPVFSLTEPEIVEPEVVVVPEGLETEEYVLTARNYKDDADVNGSVLVGFDGNDVYVQGLCTYIPEAWVKGTLAGTTVTFAKGQYFGIYADTYEMYLNTLMDEDVVFDYDAEAGTLTAQNECFLVDNSDYYFDSYRGAVLKKVAEKAAMPAAPAITALANGNYGYYITFNVPNVDVDGNGMLSSKLSYIIYTDIEGTIAPLTFTPDTHSRLTEAMTEIPYGFTENYDFYTNQIYLNELYSADWNNIGIQSIYYGGDETNATEIQWFHIKDYAAATTDVTFDFNAMDLPMSHAANGDVPASTEGDITETAVFTEGGVTLAISPKEETNSTENRFWAFTVGENTVPQLRMYSGTMTFTAPEGATITSIVFNYQGKYWGGSNNGGNVTSDNGTIQDSKNGVATWTGEAQKVVFTVGKNTQLNSIVVTVSAPGEIEKTVVLPDGVEAEEYTMSYEDKDGNPSAKPVNVAVVGNDVYFQGFSAYIPEAWVKGTKDGNTVTFHPMQLLGEYSGYESYAFYGDDDVVFTYDAEADTYTAEGEIYGVLGEQYYDGHYFNPIIKKVVDKVAMPADPEITAMEKSSYGWYIDFNVPAVDVNGEDLVIGKLSYMIYADTQGEVAPLTFTPATHSKLTEDMTEIPYGFTENYDFYTDEIYLNELYSADWTRIGIQSIYRGGGEENKTEIQWFDILPEPEAIEAPEGLETESYIFSAIDIYANANTNAARKVESEEPIEMYTYQMQVGFDGNDVYFKGVSDNTADMWLKGTLSQDGKTVTIPANQYMGQIDFYGYFTYDYFFTAVAEDGVTMEDIVLNYDAETSTFTTDQTLVLHDGKRSLGEPYQVFTNVVITKMVEFAATPADPSIDSYKFEGTSYPYIEFVIPAQDVDGNDILASKLFYTVWTEVDGVEEPFVVRADKYRDVTEDMTEIPYNWDDGYDIYKGGSRFYINPASVLALWTKFGIQSIYYGGGERNVSEIAWMENSVYTGITTVKADDLKGAAIYNLAGQRLQTVQKGLNIINGRKVVIK